MTYRVVDKCIGGKGTDRDNLIADTDYEIQTNVADFVHHVFMQGVPYTKDGSNNYGSIDGLGAAQGAAVSTTCPISWDEWRAAGPGAAMWNEWKSTLQTDRDTIVEVFDADTQTYTRTIDWDSEGNFLKYKEINALAIGMSLEDKLVSDVSSAGFEKSLVSGTNRTNNPRNSSDSALDQWRIKNLDARKHYKVQVSKGNV